MGDGFEGFRKVNKDENADATVAGGDEDIRDFDEGSFNAMVYSVARLKGFIELMDGHVLVKLVGNSPLKGFVEEGKVGDWPVVI